MPIDDATERDSDRPTQDSDVAENPTPTAPSLYDHQEEVHALQLRANPEIQSRELPMVLGNYELLAQVGQGGAGIVYRGRSTTDQSEVAVKILRPEVMASQVAARRFEKESRILAEIDSPYVTRHIEFGVHGGLYFMVSEFVDGVSLRQISDRFFLEPPRTTLIVIRDLLLALDALHSQGVVHRDVKPENVITLFKGMGRSEIDVDTVDFRLYQQIKLTDFGLARHVEQSESLAMTRQQTVLGTPLYMAPEQQSESRTVDARADIYAVGATMFHLLARRPPFEADDFMTLAAMHRDEQPKRLSSLNPEIGEAICNVVAKALEKSPEMRYLNAGEMLDDINRILAGKPTSFRIYPAVPVADRNVKHYAFEWELDAEVSQLWPLVADTDRFNRALGLPPPEFRHEADSGQRKIVARAKFNGLNVQWREHPFQWIRERELSVLREFQNGPFCWVTRTVELARLVDNRTRLTHRFQVQPRGWLGGLVCAYQFGWKTRRLLGAVYQRIEEIANDGTSPFACHVPFEKPVALSNKQQSRLESLTLELVKAEIPLVIVERLADYLRTVDDSRVARIRPIVLAKEINCSTEEALSACFRSVPLGLLKMSWDVICPVCKVAAGNQSSLEKIATHAMCEYCDLEFDVDFGRSVELIFSIHPEIRAVDHQTYCIGGPFHAPHVIAQNRLLAGESVEIGADLNQGRYQVRGPQLDRRWNINVATAGAIAQRVRIQMLDAIEDLPILKQGPVCITLGNDSHEELLTRLEQASEKQDAISAAVISRHPMFQRLFPQQVVAPHQLVEMLNVNLLLIWDSKPELSLDEMGDIQVRDNWSRILAALIDSTTAKSEIVESAYDFAIVAFETQHDLEQGLTGMIKACAPDATLPIRQFSCAITRGEVMLGNQSDQAKYFGPTMRRLKQWLNQLKPESGKIFIDIELLKTPEMQRIRTRLVQASPAVADDQVGSTAETQAAEQAADGAPEHGAPEHGAAEHGAAEYQGFKLRFD